MKHLLKVAAIAILALSINSINAGKIADQQARLYNASPSANQWRATLDYLADCLGRPGKPRNLDNCFMSPSLVMDFPGHVYNATRDIESALGLLGYLQSKYKTIAEAIQALEEEHTQLKQVLQDYQKELPEHAKYIKGQHVIFP